MKKSKNRKLTRGIMILGIILMAAAVSLVLLSQSHQKQAEEASKQTAEALLSFMPEIRTGAPDGRLNTEMAVFEFGGTDFAGVLEVPAYNAVLPVGNVWDKKTVSNHPLRYTGSMYDSSLVIGGSENKGQLDFVKWIIGGDLVMVTDMTGLRYSYLVSDVEFTKDVSYENLTGKKGDLVLFSRNPYSMEYTIVICKLK